MTASMRGGWRPRDRLLRSSAGHASLPIARAVHFSRARLVAAESAIASAADQRRHRDNLIRNHSLGIGLSNAILNGKYKAVFVAAGYGCVDQAGSGLRRGLSWWRRTQRREAAGKTFARKAGLIQDLLFANRIDGRHRRSLVNLDGVLLELRQRKQDDDHDDRDHDQQLDKGKTR